VLLDQPGKLAQREKSCQRIGRVAASWSLAISKPLSSASATLSGKRLEKPEVRPAKSPDMPLTVEYREVASLWRPMPSGTDRHLAGSRSLKSMGGRHDSCSAPSRLRLKTRWPADSFASSENASFDRRRAENLRALNRNRFQRGLCNRAKVD